MLNLGENRLAPLPGTSNNEDRAKSMEILLEESKKAHLRVRPKLEHNIGTKSGRVMLAYFDSQAQEMVK